MPLAIGRNGFHISPVDTSLGCFALCGFEVKFFGSREIVVAPTVRLLSNSFLSVVVVSADLSDPLLKNWLSNLFFVGSWFSEEAPWPSFFLFPFFGDSLVEDEVFSSFFSVAINGLSSRTAYKVATMNLDPLISSSTTFVLPNFCFVSLRRGNVNSSFHCGHDSFFDVVSNFSFPGISFTWNRSDLLSFLSEFLF